MPSAGVSTASASGSVGSIQCECSPTSCSRPKACVDVEPFDEQRVLLLQQARQHVDPRAHHQFAAPLQRARDGLDAAAVIGGEVFGLGIELLRQRVGEGRHRALQVDQGGREVARRLRQAIDQRQAIGFQRVAGSVRPAPAPAGAPARGSASAGPSGWPACTRRVQPGPGRASAARSTCCSSFSPSRPRREDRRCGRPGPAAAAVGLGPAQPAPQLGRFDRREVAGEGRVRGIEQMVALVEDDAADAARRASSSSVCASPSAWSTAA